MFRGESLPTTGTSLGIERLIDVMDILGLYPAAFGGTVVQTLVTVFSDALRGTSTQLAAELRAQGICTELYMQDKGIGKQFSHADKKGIPVVALLGPDEVAAGVVKLKRLRDGEEVIVPRAQAADKVRELLSS
jgi:histidyl-tRNA synthetase